MNGGLLICDNSLGLGRVISRRFMKMGIPSECCKGSISVMQAKLSRDRHTGVIIFAMQPERKLMSFIGQAKEMGIPVFAGLFTHLAGVHMKFRSAGVICTFTLPCSADNICRGVMLRLDADDSIQCRLKIFLEESGFPRKLSGFGYLARAAEIFMSEPDKFWGSLCGIYGEIAEEFYTKPSLVERSMRNLGKKTMENGALERITEGRITQMPTNTELICAVCDAFFRQPYK